LPLPYGNHVGVARFALGGGHFPLSTNSVSSRQLGFCLSEE
jgi:hypothetical protein